LHYNAAIASAISAPAAVWRNSDVVPVDGQNAAGQLHGAHVGVGHTGGSCGACVTKIGITVMFWQLGHWQTSHGGHGKIIGHGIAVHCGHGGHVEPPCWHGGHVAAGADAWHSVRAT